MPTNTRILVVDDDQEIRELLEEYLTKSGFDVSSVGDGVELETHLQSQGYPDLILLDVMLPGDDGFTLCQRVRKQSNVPIIMLTAVSDETDQIIGLEIGADDYIAKPFSPRQLMLVSKHYYAVFKWWMTSQVMHCQSRLFLVIGRSIH